MIDTNIFLDVLTQREPFYADSKAVLKLCESKKVQGFLSASSITDIFYLVHRYLHSTEMAYKALGSILDIAKVLSSLFTEGPFAGMRAFKKEEAEEMLSDFLKQAEVHKTGDISALLGDISERYEALSDKCRELL